MVCGLFYRTVLGFFISLNMIKTTSFIAETVSDGSRGFYLSLNEAGVTFGWAKYADASIGIDRFGASAPGGLVLDKLGINIDNVVAQATALAN